MAENRSRALQWGSARRNKTSKSIGSPNRRDGDDGDIEIRQTRLGAKLFGKLGGKWHSVFLSSSDQGIGTTATKIGMDADGAFSVNQIKLFGKIQLTSNRSKNVCIGVNNKDAGSDNIVIGVSAGAALTSSSDDNVCIGTSAGEAVTEDQNVCIGNQAGLSLTNGKQNIIIGHLSGNLLNSNTSGEADENVFIGDESARYMTRGQNNVAIGRIALRGSSGDTTNPGFNVAIGDSALTLIRTGNNNVGVGYKAGTSNLTGSNNICIGFESDLNANDDSNSIVIGASATGLGDNSMYIGNSSITKCQIDADAVGIGTAAPDAPLHIKYALVDDATSALLLESTEGGASSSPDIKFYRNSASPADDDFIGQIIFAGENDAGQEIDYGHIYGAIADKTDGTEDGQFLFRTKVNGSDNNTMWIKGGKVGIGLSGPTSPLHIDQSSTTAGIPVLTLDQGDGSEEMIEFLCVIGTGNGIEAIASKTLTTTHFIKVKLQGGLTRYIPVGTIA